MSSPRLTSDLIAQLRQESQQQKLVIETLCRRVAELVRKLNKLVFDLHLHQDQLQIEDVISKLKLIIDAAQGTRPSQPITMATKTRRRKARNNGKIDSGGNLDVIY